MSIFMSQPFLLKVISLLELISSYMGLTLVAFGLIFGSFFNVCIYRIPRGVFWDSHRSKCPSCESIIPALSNIPLLSFLLQRGKSRCCQKNISYVYPVVEVLTALLFLGAYVLFPFVGPDGLPHQNQLIRFIHTIVLSSILLICSTIDLEHQIIPDELSWPMIFFGPLVAYFHPELSLSESLQGVFFGAAMICTIIYGYYKIRGVEGMGLGDAKLLAFIGGWLGVRAVLPVLMLGSILGSLIAILGMVKNRRIDGSVEIAFGPFLAVGALIYMVAPRHVLPF